MDPTLLRKRRGGGLSLRYGGQEARGDQEEERGCLRSRGRLSTISQEHLRAEMGGQKL